ncbi:hypothetical protein LEP1GSC179_3897 [Leptospira santarosai str. MOR084]|uniref:Uncharacterized protein n=1 Tax=Leptospira santarosai str. MOR084 TaxID=1049984 RepID=A0A0E2BDB4_9LEPT|nr:hypothetical protein LEP1GSC179_3897 [Leptospira santarosai str. MOR084]
MGTPTFSKSKQHCGLRIRLNLNRLKRRSSHKLRLFGGLYRFSNGYFVVQLLWEFPHPKILEQIFETKQSGELFRTLDQKHVPVFPGRRSGMFRNKM